MAGAELIEQFSPPAQRTVWQHYVPVCYLERFVDANSGIFAFDKVSQRSFKTGPRRVAAEKNFYEIGVVGDDPARNKLNDLQLVERALQIAEGDFAKASELLLAEGPHVGIAPDLKNRIVQYIVIQHLRSARMRQKTVEVHNAMLNVQAKAIMENEFGPGAFDNLRVSLNDADEFLPQLQVMFDPRITRDMENVLLGHEWHLALAPEGEAFITSDHPVAIRASTGTRAGIGSQGVAICFPLSPRVAVVMRDRSSAHLVDREDAAVAVSRDSLKRLNRIQVAYSRRWVFSGRDEFDDAMHFCKAHPFITDPDREDVETIYHKIRKRGPRPGQLIQFAEKRRRINWDV